MMTTSQKRLNQQERQACLSASRAMRRAIDRLRPRDTSWQMQSLLRDMERDAYTLYCMSQGEDVKDINR